MTIAANTGMLCTSGMFLLMITAGLATSGFLTLKHLAVFGDAMAITHGNVMLRRMRFMGCGCPGEVVATDLHVIVCELAQLVIVHAEKLGFFGSSELEAWNLIDDESEDGGDDEGVSGGSADVAELDIELLPIVLDPTTSVETSVHTIETNNVACTEYTIGEEAKHAGDPVLGEHIERIINLDPEFD